jgi:hypothetical protein
MKQTHFPIVGTMAHHWQAIHPERFRYKFHPLSHWGYESGFTGFLGLTITSSVGVGRLLLDGAFISKPLADA